MVHILTPRSELWVVMDLLHVMGSMRFRNTCRPKSFRQLEHAPRVNLAYDGRVVRVAALQALVDFPHPSALLRQERSIAGLLVSLSHQRTRGVHEY